MEINKINLVLMNKD